MPIIAQITKVDRVTVDPTRPQFSTGTNQLIVEVHTVGGPAVLEISRSAAAELMEALARHLQAGGSP